MNDLERDMSEMKDFRKKYKSHKLLIDKLYLVALIDSYYRLKYLCDIRNFSENEIRNEIQKDFEYNNGIITDYINQETITFNSEAQIITKENDVHRTDIKLFCAFFRKSFVVECKKFNPFNNDYIEGHFDKNKNRYIYNGIERFTEQIYAKNDNYAGMIGFVCSGDIGVIVKKLKSKIQNFKLVIDSEELLETKCVDWEFSFQSKHIRKDNTEIHLYHLFLNLIN